MEDIDSGNYSAVGLCNARHPLGINSVAEHSVLNMQALCEALSRLNYRRPALMISEMSDLERQGILSSTFLRFQQKFFPDNPIPVPVSLEQIEGRAESLEWVKKWRPDVVIGHSHEMYDRFREAGFRIPEDSGYVHVHLGPDTPGWAGINPKQSSLGAAAAEAVIALIHRNETGPPHHS